MSDKKRQKKAGMDKGKKNQARRDGAEGLRYSLTVPAGRRSTISVAHDRGRANLSPSAARRQASRRGKGK
jgi:hypothetical protein